jgi:hypothetical protein
VSLARRLTARSPWLVALQHTPSRRLLMRARVARVCSGAAGRTQGRQDGRCCGGGGDGGAGGQRAGCHAGEATAQGLRIGLNTRPTSAAHSLCVASTRHSVLGDAGEYRLCRWLFNEGYQVSKRTHDVEQP